MTYLSSCGSCSCGYSSGSGSYSLENIASSASSYSGSSCGSRPVIYTMEAASLPAYDLSFGSAPIQSSSSHFQRYASNDTKYNSKYDSEQNTRSRNEYMIPPPLLRDDRPAAQFVDNASEIRQYVEQIFELTTDDKLPEDITIEVVSESELQKKHESMGGKWSPAIQGFSINNRGFGTSHIIVKKNRLDQLLITVGHEIGHVMSFAMNTPVDEEAKAFAFEMAWIKAIYEHDVANLRNSLNLNPNPANNGLHNIAFNFVKNLIDGGNSAMQIFKSFVKGEMRLGE